MICLCSFIKLIFFVFVHKIWCLLSSFFLRINLNFMVFSHSTSLNSCWTHLICVHWQTTKCRLRIATPFAFVMSKFVIFLLYFLMHAWALWLSCALFYLWAFFRYQHITNYRILQHLAKILYGSKVLKSWYFDYVMALRRKRKR